MSSPNTNPTTYERKMAKTQRYVKELALSILDTLEGLSPFVSYADENSVMIKFNACPKLGSLRIGSEPGHPQYIPRWNLCCGTNKEQESKYKSYWYEANHYIELTDHMARYADTVLRNEARDASLSEESGVPPEVRDRELPPLSAYADDNPYRGGE